MTLAEIKAAVLAGKTVHWSNPTYSVIVTHPGPTNRLTADQWLIKCAWNGHCIGLTHADGVSMNGQPEDFHLAP